MVSPFSKQGQKLKKNGSEQKKLKKKKLKSDEGAEDPHNISASALSTGEGKKSLASKIFVLFDKMASGVGMAQNISEEHLGSTLDQNMSDNDEVRDKLQISNSKHRYRAADHHSSDEKRQKVVTSPKFQQPVLVIP